MKIIFATNNRHKLTEAQEILGNGYQLVTPCDLGITENIPEEQPTLEGNAFQKARYLYDRTGLDCFADDTGLEVDALGGEMDSEAKNAISHRGRAVEKLAAFLSGAK